MYKKIPPSDKLKPYIDYYFLIETATPHPVPQIVYPYGSVILVFHFKEPYYFQNKKMNKHREATVSLCGPQTSFYELTASRETGMVFVVFKTFSPNLFIPIPMRELRDLNIDFKDLDPEAMVIEEQISSALTPERKCRLLNSYLEEKLKRNYANTTHLRHALNILNVSTQRISRLADMININQRRLERLFARFVGLSPKQYQIIRRFTRICQPGASAKDLTELALDCGYYDQSHFIHEFKELTGQPPGAFFSRE